jgi:hypothetical protein
VHRFTIKPSRGVGGNLAVAGGGIGQEDPGAEGTSKNLSSGNMQAVTQDLAVELYKGPPKSNEKLEETEEDFEIELDEEEALESSKVLGIAIFYSWTSYNPQILFSDMINAWGIQRLAAVEKLEDYMFKIEFVSEEEKTEFWKEARGATKEMLCW